MRMLGNEAQLAGYHVFLAFPGLALSERLEGVVEHLHIILRPTDIARKSGHRQPRLHLIGSDDDPLKDYETADQRRVELADRSDCIGFGRAMYDDDVKLAMHARRNELIFGKIAGIIPNQILTTLFFKRIFQLMPKQLHGE